jgi:hypothetical protein
MGQSNLTKSAAVDGGQMRAAQPGARDFDEDFAVAGRIQYGGFNPQRPTLGMGSG